MANPEVSTNRCVPDPLHAGHLVRVAPFLSPDPVHVLHSTTGVILTAFRTPLHPSKNEIFTIASMSWPLDGRARPPVAAPNS